MSNSIIPQEPTEAAVIRLAGITRAIECGFVAAGFTIAVIAAAQSIGAVFGWIAAAL